MLFISATYARSYSVYMISDICIDRLIKLKVSVLKYEKIHGCVTSVTRSS